MSTETLLSLRPPPEFENLKIKDLVNLSGQLRSQALHCRVCSSPWPVATGSTHGYLVVRGTTINQKLGS